MRIKITNPANDRVITVKVIPELESYMGDGGYITELRRVSDTSLDSVLSGSCSRQLNRIITRMTNGVKNAPFNAVEELI